MATTKTTAVPGSAAPQAQREGVAQATATSSSSTSRDEVTLEGAAAQLFSKMLPQLDGKTGIEADRRASSSEQPARLRALAEQLAQGRRARASSRRSDDGALMTRRASSTSSTASTAHYWLAATSTAPAVGEDHRPARPRARRCIGFAFEKYHYIEGAFEHMGIAAANATPEMMPHLARHFIEEYTHGDIYRKGLRSLFPDDVVLRAQPLPSHARAGELPQRVGGAQLVRATTPATSSCR